MRTLIILLSIIIISCNDVEHAKHHKGDIIYLKPDSTRGVVERIRTAGELYQIRITPSYWYETEHVYCGDEMIY